MGFPINMLVAVFAAIAIILGAGLIPPQPKAAEPAGPTELETFGQALFFDKNLSLKRTQSCATCHDPANGFADPRPNRVNAMVSLGDDGLSLGQRNAPTASYAAFIPAFGERPDGRLAGGLFHDGRAASLEEQAGGPPLNAAEMGLPGKQTLLERLLENPAYVAYLESLFGAEALTEEELAFDAVRRAIAAFERTEFFAPFDSRYDRYLRGEYQMTPEEDLGMTLFFSQQFTNCNLCHQLKPRPGQTGETFSDYSYHNIGVPENTVLKAISAAPDQGLADNPRSGKAEHAGLFKVPTLRNVAVTAPYMHNGVFRDLRTVVLFYNQFNSRSAKRQINPETGVRWGAPEYPDNLSMDELMTGPALDDRRIDALVAFLRTLTDQRYEPLLNQQR